MHIPVPSHYLALALKENCSLGNITLTLRSVGDLLLPTGQLVACDPFMCPETPSFARSFPQGTFPVLLSIAEADEDQRVAFATIMFNNNTPVQWQMLTVGDQDVATLKEDEFFGYGVDAGTGCFMDSSAATLLDKQMRDDENACEAIDAEMEKTYRHTWSWATMNIGDGNLVAFSSGFGDGVYGTYAGLDTDGEVCVVVTDFSVVPFEDTKE